MNLQPIVIIMKLCRLTMCHSCMTGCLGDVMFQLVFTVNGSAIRNRILYSVNISITILLFYINLC